MPIKFGQRAFAQSSILFSGYNKPLFSHKEVPFGTLTEEEVSSTASESGEMGIRVSRVTVRAAKSRSHHIRVQHKPASWQVYVVY